MKETPSRKEIYIEFIVIQSYIINKFTHDTNLVYKNEKNIKRQ